MALLGALVTLCAPIFVQAQADLVPPAAARFIGKSSQINGPNCFNFALIATGIQKTARYVGVEESGFYFHPSSGYCTLSKTPKRGDVGLLVRSVVPNEKYLMHAFIYLTSEFALTKNNPSEEAKWEIANVEDMLKHFPKPGNEFSHDRIEYYHCEVPKTRTTNAKLQNEIDRFSSSVEKIFLQSSITANQVQEMQDGLEQVRQKLDTNSASKEQLYELLSYARSLESIDESKTALGTPLFDEEKTFKSFRSFQDRYMDFIDELLKAIAPQKIMMQDVFYGESAYGHEYCRRRNQLPLLCQESH